jgi:flagellar biosynthesis protein FlhA
VLVRIDDDGIDLAQAVEANGAISPDIISKLLKATERIITDNAARGIQPIILCSAHIRRFLRKITERFLPSLVVLSNAEISPSVKLQITGVVRYED